MKMNSVLVSPECSRTGDDAGAMRFESQRYWVRRASWTKDRYANHVRGTNDESITSSG